MRHSNFIVPIALIGIFYLLHIIFIRIQNRSREKKNQKVILHSQIEMQEQTFQKISTEIHDNISLTLSLSKLYLHDLDYNDQKDLHDKIGLSVFLLKKAMEDLNNLSKSLNPDTIERFGLIRTVEEQVNDISKTNLFAINFQVHGIPQSIGSNNELILFRMIQESLNNIVKHSNATRASITMDFDISHLNVRVQDNGIGFNTEHIHSCNEGSGFSNLKKRAQMINAQLFMDSRPKNGTNITIIVPFKNNLTL